MSEYTGRPHDYNERTLYQRGFRTLAMEQGAQPGEWAIVGDDCWPDFSVGPTGPAGAVPALTHVTYTFSFDTSGLATGIGFYTPSVGDILYNAWFQVITAFDGATPQADVGSPPYGYFGSANMAVPLGVAETNNGGIFNNAFQRNSSSLLAIGYQNLAAPGQFVDTSPVQVWATQSGQAGGAAVGGTAGQATIHLLILR